MVVLLTLTHHVVEYRLESLPSNFVHLVSLGHVVLPLPLDAPFFCSLFLSDGRESALTNGASICHARPFDDTGLAMHMATAVKSP
jgi:hypothetical protein